MNEDKDSPGWRDLTTFQKVMALAMSGVAVVIVIPLLVLAVRGVILLWEMVF